MTALAWASFLMALSMLTSSHGETIVPLMLIAQPDSPVTPDTFTCVLDQRIPCADGSIGQSGKK